jgi:hypothetical protein
MYEYMGILYTQLLIAKKGTGEHSAAVSQALYLSQCAATVCKHLRHMLDKLSSVSQTKLAGEGLNAHLAEQLTGDHVYLYVCMCVACMGLNAHLAEKLMGEYMSACICIGQCPRRIISSDSTTMLLTAQQCF